MNEENEQYVCVVSECVCAGESDYDECDCVHDLASGRCLLCGNPMKAIDVYTGADVGLLF